MQFLVLQPSLNLALLIGMRITLNLSRGATNNILGTSNYVQGIGNAANARQWDLVSVSEAFLHPPNIAEVTIPYCARNSDIKLFTVLNFVYSKLVKACFILEGCPRLGKFSSF
jgi:hypothetical protein